MIRKQSTYLFNRFFCPKSNKESYGISTIQLLITKERVNQPCPDTGNTPLITAYLNDDLEFNEFNDELIDLLLEAGAHPIIKNKQNQTAITIVKLKYNDRDQNDDDADNYDDDLEEQVNQLAFISHDIYLAQDVLLEDKSENFNAKLKLKSHAFGVLNEINDYIENDYKKAQLQRAKLQFEIASIHRDRFVFNMDDDFEKVIVEFEKLTCVCMENYKHAQFEIASLLIFVAGREQKDSVEHRGMLIRALKHADNAQDNVLSNFIIGDLSGKVITDTSMPLPANSYERIHYLTGVIRSQAQKILALEKQLAALKQPTSSAASLSGLIRKRSDSPVFSVIDSEDSCSSSKKPCLSKSML